LPVTGLPEFFRNGVTACVFAQVRHHGPLYGVQFGAGVLPPLIELRRQVDPVVSLDGHQMKYRIILVPANHVTRHGTSSPAAARRPSPMSADHPPPYAQP
jgi:hypothetical protein